MSIHRPAHTFCDTGTDGVITIGEAAAQVMARLEWNRMKWKREQGHADHARRMRRLRAIEAIWSGR